MRTRGSSLMSAVVGLLLITTATAWLAQAVAASLRAERHARERLVATQWLAGALDELRVTGGIRVAPPQSLRAARLVTERKPAGGRYSQVSLTLRWREVNGAARQAKLVGAVTAP